MMLDVCCGPCSTHVIEILKDKGLTLFFPNSNIYPKEEYDKRLAEAQKMADFHGLGLIVPEYDHGLWLDYIRKESDVNSLEGGKRCMACYRYRLEKTAAAALANNEDSFSTTLTISPHKDPDKINLIGHEVARRYAIRFESHDFRPGFKRSVELSKEKGLYRQRYCGCEFSIKDRN